MYLPTVRQEPSLESSTGFKSMSLYHNNVTNLIQFHFHNHFIVS
jgi:hypothetical protein